MTGFFHAGHFKIADLASDDLMQSEGMGCEVPVRSEATAAMVAALLSMSVDVVDGALMANDMRKPNISIDHSALHTVATNTEDSIQNTQSKFMSTCVHWHNLCMHTIRIRGLHCIRMQHA